MGIVDEHPEWSSRLIAELTSRRLPWEKIDHSNHGYDPRDRQPRYSVIVNRSSPSSHRRGHGNVLFYTEALLRHYESIGIPVINPVAAYRFEKSKALQIDLFERLGLRYPRAVVLNHCDQLLKAADALRFPVVVKPNVGGSGAGIVRLDSRAELEARASSLDFGPDGTALLQEYVEAREGAIVRVEVLDGACLYAIRIVRTTDDFNLCPADICQVPAAAPALAACPVDVTPGMSVSRYDAPPEAIEGALALARVASIDVGGVEYLVGRDDGRIYFYDVNATSNFVANAPEVLGFDPFGPFVDSIVAVATRGRRRAAARRVRTARAGRGGPRRGGAALAAAGPAQRRGPSA
ncbi:MAG: ATP-grasp domain-containing protein [Candidatus Rokubacteria bacterium]|nr:ATP-grasp domain-containing protein [Candidatus Rokubacteria bacterium]